jgi:molybdopterin/thiamine biosynthesis adenylyltransferase/proteasome lid subunit RPN8/RPN11
VRSGPSLVLTEDVWGALAHALTLGVESAGVLIAGRAEDANQLTLLGREMLWVPEDWYEVREPDALNIKSPGYVPFLKRAADEGSLALFVHTQPNARPRPSKWDREVDDQLREVFKLRTRQDLYGSLVAGGSEQTPTLYGEIETGGQVEAFKKVRIVGRRVRILRPYAGEGESTTLAEEAFDRQIRAFGREGQEALRQLHVGVVGAGGTGSSVCEQLIRLGVGTITVADDDVVDASNLSRLYGANRGDIGMPKVDVVARSARSIGLGTVVEPIDGRLTKEEVAAAFRHCDVLFGCTDDNAGRLVLSRLAYWYLIPAFDVAFRITSADDRITGLYGRVSTLLPETACLLCRRQVNRDAARAEVLPPEERARLEVEGYVAGLEEPNPAVVSFTTLVAALGVSQMLERLIGFGADQPPTELIVRLQDHKLSGTSPTGNQGHYCTDPSVLGRGDVDPLLGQVWSA